ncbi:Uncharacterised protein [Bordetella pertussis]|nr:Uncharacterised protein [Bordetella pertussis]
MNRLLAARRCRMRPPSSCASGCCSDNWRLCLTCADW